MFNIFSSNSAVEVREKDIRKISADLKGPEPKILISDPDYHMCKVDIECTNMKKLVDEFKTFIADSEKEYKQKTAAVINAVKDQAQKIESGVGLAQLFTLCEKSKAELINEQKKRDEIRSKGKILITAINCKVNVMIKKDKENSAPQPSVVEGLIKKIRIYTDTYTSTKELIGASKKGEGMKTAVDIEYIDPKTKKTEKITDYELSKICIVDDCSMQNGGQRKVDDDQNNNGGGDYITICE